MRRRAASIGRGGTMLSPEQHATRLGIFNASFAPILMAHDDPDRILKEWRHILDAANPAYVEDLSHHWPAIVGSVIETPALDHWEWRHGHKLTRRGEQVRHPARPWCQCTLDGYREADDTVIDVKAGADWMSADDLRAYYAAQLIIQQENVGAANAAILWCASTREPVEIPMVFKPEFRA